MERLLICGVSTRAAAESAARAGFQVTALDAFADLDQHRSVRALSISRDFGAPPTASTMARAARRLDADAVIYLSPFENHPDAVSALTGGRMLWGNSPETLRRVRDPFRLAAVLRRHGFAVPRLRSNDSHDSNDPNNWVLKPFRSGGGNRIRRWRGGSVVPGTYLQEWIEGVPGSLIFAAANGRAVPLGFSRQLAGDASFGARAYRYCGSILASLDDPQFHNGPALCDAAAALAQCVTAEFGLVGINGIDFIARGDVPLPLEVNARWSASVEVAEQAFGVTFFLAHADACRSGTLPQANTDSWHGTAAAGKAIVYARRSGIVADTSAWLDDPTVRDVPRSGEFFRAGQPICSVVAIAGDSHACYRALVARAERVYAGMVATSREPARLPS